MSESDFELMRSDIPDEEGHDDLRPNEVYGSRGGLPFGLSIRQYEADLAAINDKKVSIMKDYLNHHADLNDQQAKQLAEDRLFRRRPENSRPTGQVLRGIGKSAAVQDHCAVACSLSVGLQLLVDAQLAQDFPAIKK